MTLHNLEKIKKEANTKLNEVNNFLDNK
jgi:hypothetical protein